MLAIEFESFGDGRRVRYARAGDGEDLVLLHGYPDNLQIWSTLVPELSSKFRVLAFDWPGMGESDAWSGGATPGHMAERLAAILTHFGIERAHVVGMDMGGQPALVFAATYPQRTRTVTVMNSLVFGDEVTSWEIALLRKFQFNRLALRCFPRIVFARALRTFLPRGVTLPDALRSDLWRSFRRTEVRRFISKMCAGYQGHLPRLPSLYAKIQCPALVVWAEAGKHFPLVQARRLHQSIPGSRLTVLPEAEHWMVVDRAAEVARQITDFIKST